MGTVVKIRYGRWWWQTLRRTIPDDLTFVGTRRRLRVLRALLADPTPATARLRALPILLDIPRKIWDALPATALDELQTRAAWLSAEPSATPLLRYFEHRGERYYLPKADFTNGTCLEWSMADDAFRDFADGNPDALPKLCAILCREPEPDEASAQRRDDRRVPLHSGTEVDERREKLEGLPDALLGVALLYWMGVALLIRKMYGDWLFKKPPEKEEGDEDDNPEEETQSGDPMGWWGFWFDACEGDASRIESVYHSNFHTFCIIEVRRRKAAQEAEQRQKLRIG